MKKIKIIAAALSVSAMMMCIPSSIPGTMAAEYIYDFETESISWSCLYSNANLSREEEEDGNHYIRISYNGNGNRNREYYDVRAYYFNNAVSSGIVQVDYDVMYDGDITGKNGDMQIKKRTGPGTAQTTMVSRVGVNNSYLRWHDEDNKVTAFKTTSNATLTIEQGHWYSIKAIMDLDNATQTLYVFDRDTGELLSYMEPKTTIGGSCEVNSITFSSEEDMCVDNFRVSTLSYAEGMIYGAPYVTSATKNKYYLFGKNSAGRITALPVGEITWELETPRSGVSVDSATGRIIVGSKPEPGPVILKAVDAANAEDIVARYVVNVSQ